MPNHSESYLKRQNNPKGQFKSESEHIKHVQQRMKERFDLDITVEEYYELLESIQKVNTRIYSITCNSALFEIEYKGKLIWIIYGYKQDELPARIKTVLRPYDQYVVPKKLDEIYDHIEFTVEIKKFLNTAIELASSLDLNNKRDFFLKEGHNHHIKCASLAYKQLGRINPTMVGIANKSLILRYYPKDTE